MGARDEGGARRDVLLEEVEQVVGADVVGVPLPGPPEGVHAGGLLAEAEQGGRERLQAGGVFGIGGDARVRDLPGVVVATVAHERFGHEGEERAVAGVDGEVFVAGPGVPRAVVQQQRGRRRDAGRADIVRVGAAKRRHVAARPFPVLRVERQLGPQGERAGVRRVDGERPRDLVAGGGGVVAVDDGDARQPEVGVGVVGVELQNVAETGFGVGRVVLLEQHRAPVEVGGGGARLGAHGVAQDVVRVLPVAVEADGGRDREQVRGMGAVERPPFQSA